jgi:hypothetical protein
VSTNPSKLTDGYLIRSIGDVSVSVSSSHHGGEAGLLSHSGEKLVLSQRASNRKEIVRHTLFADWAVNTCRVSSFGVFSLLVAPFRALIDRAFHSSRNRIAINGSFLGPRTESAGSS